MKDMTISKALKWIFIAELLAILAFIPAVGVILAIISLVLNLMALNGAGKLDPGYKNAFTLSIVAIVLALVGAVLKAGVFSSILSLVSAIVNLAILYFVVMTTVKHLEGSPVAAKGVTVWKLNVICTVVALVLGILLLIIPLLAMVLAVIVTIVEIVAAVLYLVFLYKAANALA